MFVKLALLLSAMAFLPAVGLAQINFVIDRIVTNRNSPGPIALQDGAIIWAENPYTTRWSVVLRKMTATGGNITTLTQINTAYPYGAYATGICTDSNRVYVSINAGGYGMGAICSVPISGGMPVWLASAHQPSDISCNDSRVIWAEENGGTDSLTGIRSVQKTGGTVTTFSTEGYESKLIVAGDFVYFSKSQSYSTWDPATSTLCRVPILGGVVESLVTNWASNPSALNSIGPISLSGEFVYWGGSKGTISKLSLTDGSAAIIYNGSNSIERLLVSGNQIFWIEKGTNFQNFFRFSSSSGNNFKTIASGRFASLAMNLGYVYAADLGTNSQNGSILRVQRPVDSIPLSIFQTNRTPTAPEITPPVIFPGPYPQQLKTFVNGLLTSNAPNPNKMTIVLTHGWDSNPDAWAMNMANEISLNVAGSPNILIWDWQGVASGSLCDWNLYFLKLAATARQTPDQGFALGQALFSKLGPTYSNRIHFVGHSMGTLVNGWAALWLHNRGFAPTNTHLTLLDEAEAATDLGCVDLVNAVVQGQWNPLAPKPYYFKPLPPKFGWADNYISAFGFLHPDAHNVILTNGFPANAANRTEFKNQLFGFHSYPCAWYLDTVITDVSAMGHRWSFERNGFTEAPSTNTVFLQSFNGSHWNLAQTNYAGGSNYLNTRFQKYRNALAYAITHRTPGSIQANGAVSGEMLATGPANAFDLIVLNLLTRPASGPQIRSASPVGSGNSSACAWLPLPVPVNAVSMSFDFKIEGDWQDDSLAAALNGTNVFLLTTSQVETNVMLNSGLFDVTPYAGRTNEFFVGIIGGTSTNALLTVQNVVFYTAAPPSLQTEASGGSLKISWPFTAQNFILESTTNLAASNSWTTVTNVPAVADLQNAVTNSISNGTRFYRLKK